MNTTLKELLAEARSLPPVPLAGAQAYNTNIDRMTAMVNAAIENREDFDRLVAAPVQMMHDNHRHHGAFMATVFGINGYELLARTIPWVYRAYTSHGFSHDYFPAELTAWKDAVSECIDQRKRAQILRVYDWMLCRHETMIELAQLPPEGPLPIRDDWLEVKNLFRSKLLEGDSHHCLEIARKYTEDPARIVEFYSCIIQPALYEIGQMWETGKISVAQEHLASAVVSRIMASIAAGPLAASTRRGRAVVTAGPGEFHEIGAWMLSDALEQDGWEVSYLGANTPPEDLQKMLDDLMPNLLAISVTMSFNIARTKQMIESIRRDRLHGNMKILVGGRVFIDNPEIKGIVGADGFAENLGSALRITREWAN